eukprot:CAMPEP_0169129202 /NCGR_PEP_ID=MMETSP1015-20121227/36997_1 /TAXON_ID=342587 /ORGANISM="Karlodinium micrum, Strain CCMP2283" /LENGTH=182 /DNA_ID=CAMNT_0009193199 /DNA_START=85 /DNA_END=634 /DNA_ORIENTATION=+
MTSSDSESSAAELSDRSESSCFKRKTCFCCGMNNVAGTKRALTRMSLRTCDNTGATARLACSSSSSVLAVTTTDALGGAAEQPLGNKELDGCALCPPATSITTLLSTGMSAPQEEPTPPAKEHLRDCAKYLEVDPPHPDLPVCGELNERAMAPIFSAPNNHACTRRRPRFCSAFHHFPLAQN